MNEAGTGAESDASLTQPRSPSVRDLKAASKHFNTLRRKHGSRSAIGSHCTNVIEIIDIIPPGPDERIEYLTADFYVRQHTELLKEMGKQLAVLSRLMGTGTVQ